MKIIYKKYNVANRALVLCSFRLMGYGSLLFLLLFGSCKKMIEVPAPVNTINAGNVFASNLTAIGTVNNIFVGSNFNDFYLRGGLLADELTLYTFSSISDYTLFYQNALTATNTGSLPWDNTYTKIFYCNAAIEGLTASSSLAPAIKQQLLGEAKFMRAFFYFYLVNLYGDVPLALTTDPEVNRLLSRAPQSDVYAQIIKDLKDAQTLISRDFLDGTLLSTTTVRVRPTYWAATALLARAYLYSSQYQNQYQLAIDQATEVINNSSLFSLSSLNHAFLKNSSETIWAIQSQPNSQFYNTPEGAIFVLPSSGPGSITAASYPVYLSDSIVNAFEPGDARRTNWVDSVIVSRTNPVRIDTFYYPYKYKAGLFETNVTEYEIVLRIAEQYLIRAEAKARLGDIAGAVADLNVIRTRARAAVTIAVPNPLPNLSASLSAVQVYAAIEQERKVELFTEWGHRWFDLKRTPGFIDPSKTRADEVMPAVTTAKGGTWSDYKKLMPISQSQLLISPNMTHAQNAGY